MNNTDLDNVLCKMDATACVNALEKLTEKERKQLSERALEWLLVADHFDHPQLKPWLRPGISVRDLPRNLQKLHSLRDEARKLAPGLPAAAQQPTALQPARAAVFSTCTLTEIKKYGAQPVDLDICYTVIKTRQPRWTSQWARQMLEDCPEIYWKLIRRLEMESLVTLEIGPEYLLGMAIGIATAGDITGQFRGDEVLRDRLWAMLEDDSVTRLFLSQRPAERSQRDRYWTTLRHVGGKWSPGLVQLAKDGIIPRLQLLEVTLSVLTRLALEASEGAVKANLNWYISLQTELCATPEEDEKLVENYIRLLYSRNAATVSWTIGRLKQMTESHAQLPAESVSAGLGAVLLVKGKENAIKAIDCLATLAKEIPSARTTVLLSTLQAMESESQDIQKRALSLIEKYGAGNAQLTEELQNNLDRIAIVHRQRAQDWLAKQQGSAHEKNAGATAGSGTGADFGTEIGTAIGAITGAGVGNGAVASAGPSGVIGGGGRAGAGAEIRSGIGAGGTDIQSPDLEELLHRCSGVPEPLQIAAGIAAAADAIKSGSSDVPALDFNGNEFPRLNPNKAVKSIGNFDELVFLLTKLLQDFESAGDADAIERAMDGIVRVGAQPPDDFQDRVRPILSTAMIGSLGTTVKQWLIGPTFQPLSGFARSQPHPIDMILQCRLSAAGRLARERKPTVLLSTPTHEGGWLDPLVLVERTIHRSGRRDSQPTAGKSFTDLKSLTKTILRTTNYLLGGGNSAGTDSTDSAPRDDHEVFDECLALLRLAPDNRQDALALLLAAKPRQSEFVNALRYALGEPDVPIGASAPLWVAAARARDPFANDSEVENKFPALGPDTGWSARYELLTNTLPKNRFRRPDCSKFKFIERLPKSNAVSKPIAIMAALHQSAERENWGWHWGCGFNYHDWASTMCPMLLEGWFAHCAEALVLGDDGYSDANQTKRCLEKLYNPDVPLKQMALLTLVLGLSAKPKEVQGAALEVLIQAIDDGRLNSDKLADMWQTLRAFERAESPDEYGMQLISLSRCAKALKTAAQTSPYHARVVGRMIEQTLKGDSQSPPQHLHALLEVILEVYVQQQQAITLAEAREYLSGIKISGKTEKLIKQLLALKPGGNVDTIRIEALVYALEKRIERAQRWHSWAQQNQEALSDRTALAVSP